MQFVIATLCIVVLRGTTAMQRGVHIPGNAIARDAVWITLLYLGALAIFIVAYYVLQRTA